MKIGQKQLALAFSLAIKEHQEKIAYAREQGYPPPSPMDLRRTLVAISKLAEAPATYLEVVANHETIMKAHREKGEWPQDTYYKQVLTDLREAAERETPRDNVVEFRPTA